MTPDPTTFTPRANRRPRPRKIPPPFYNLLDGNAEEDYHGNTRFRASTPVHVSGGSSVKPPPSSSRPSIVILFPFRSIYSENITPFQSIKFAKEHHSLNSRSESAQIFMYCLSVKPPGFLRPLYSDMRLHVGLCRTRYPRPGSL